MNGSGAPVYAETIGGTPPAAGGFNGPFGLSYGPNGELYVADWFNHRIEKFNPDRSFATQWGGYGTGDGSLIFPRGVLVEPDGTVLVTDSENNRLSFFNANGGFVDTLIPLVFGLNRPGQTAVAADGTFWIADSDNNRLVHIDSAGDRAQGRDGFGQRAAWHRDRRQRRHLRRQRRQRHAHQVRQLREPDRDARDGRRRAGPAEGPAQHHDRRGGRRGVGLRRRRRERPGAGLRHLGRLHRGVRGGDARRAQGGRALSQRRRAGGLRSPQQPRHVLPAGGDAAPAAGHGPARRGGLGSGVERRLPDRPDRHDLGNGDRQPERRRVRRGRDQEPRHQPVAAGERHVGDHGLPGARHPRRPRRDIGELDPDVDADRRELRGERHHHGLRRQRGPESPQRPVLGHRDGARHHAAGRDGRRPDRQPELLARDGRS